MRYQQSTFPLVLYGHIDAASHKVVWLRILTDNFLIKKIARWYFDDFFEKKIVVARLRTDKGSESGNITSMHTFLRGDRDGLEDHSGSVIFGKSTANEIKRWWRHLHDSFEKYLNSFITDVSIILETSPLICTGFYMIGTISYYLS